MLLCIDELGVCVCVCVFVCLCVCVFMSWGEYSGRTQWARAPLLEQIQQGLKHSPLINLFCDIKIPSYKNSLFTRKSVIKFIIAYYWLIPSFHDLQVYPKEKHWSGPN